MQTFQVTYVDKYRRNVSFKVRGICQFDVLNPCWDNRPGDVAGKHWGEGDACPACTKAAKAAERKL